MDLRTYWRSVYRLRGGFKAKAAPLVNQIYSNDKEAKEQAMSELMEVIEQYRTHTYKIGVRLLTQEANKLDADPFIPDAQPYQKRWLEQAMRETKSPAGLLLRLEKHVTAAGRRVITQAVPAPVAGGTTDNPSYKQAQPYREEDMPGTQGKTGAKTGPSGRRLIYPVAFARVLSGPRNCAFCVMLASRGPVYSSASHAGAKGVKGVFTAWTPSSQWPNSFHDSCDCLVVPVYNPTGAWMGKSQSEYLYKFWLQTTKGKTNLKDSGGENESLIAFRQKLTEMKENGETLDIEDLRETDTDKTKEAEPQENKSHEAPQIPEENPKQQEEKTQAPEPEEPQGQEEKKPETQELTQPQKSIEELGAEELQAAENYLTKTVTETIDAQDLPVYENLEEQFDKEFEAISWHGHEPTKRGGHSPDGTIRGKSRMPAGSTYQDFLQAILATVQEPDYYSTVNKVQTFLKRIKLPSDLSLLFQVKIKEQTQEIIHAYPVAGLGVTIYNPKKEEPTPAEAHPGVLRKELRRVTVRN